MCVRRCCLGRGGLEDEGACPVALASQPSCLAVPPEAAQYVQPPPPLWGWFDETWVAGHGVSGLSRVGPLFFLLRLPSL